MNNFPVKDSKPDQPPAANQNAEHDLKVRLLSGDAEIIDAIILAGSVEIRAKDLHAIIRERELIEKKFQAISMGYHELRHQNQRDNANAGSGRACEYHRPVAKMSGRRNIRGSILA